MSGQSKFGSPIESLINIGIGYGIATASQMAIFPIFNIHIPVTTHL